MRYIFIINPTSGVRNFERYIPWIEEYFDDVNKYEIHITEYPNHAREIASRYSVRDNVCVFSIGGDGTAYEVLNGLRDGVAMAIVPNGTGNDFHRTIYTKKFDSKEMLIRTIEGQIMHIDYGIANEHRFLNMFCVGLDAAVGKEANKYSNRKYFPNSLSYVAAAVGKIAKPVKFEVEFRNNDEMMRQDTLMFSVFNGKYYGGGFNPTPYANIDDGFFEVLWVESVTRRVMLPLIPKYASGKHEDIKQIKRFKLKDFSLRLDQKMTYVCDGEIFEDDYIVVTMMENRLPFMIPKGSDLIDNPTE